MWRPAALPLAPTLPPSSLHSSLGLSLMLEGSLRCLAALSCPCVSWNEGLDFISSRFACRAGQLGLLCGQLGGDPPMSWALRTVTSGIHWSVSWASQSCSGKLPSLLWAWRWVDRHTRASGVLGVLWSTLFPRRLLCYPYFPHGTCCLLSTSPEGQLHFLLVGEDAVLAAQAWETVRVNLTLHQPSNFNAVSTPCTDMPGVSTPQASSLAVAPARGPTHSGGHSFCFPPLRLVSHLSMAIVALSVLPAWLPCASLSFCCLLVGFP